MTCSQMPGNLFLLCKLKGNCNFAIQAITIRNEKAKEDPGKKPKGEGETEPSADKAVEALDRIGEMTNPSSILFTLQKWSNCIKRKTGTVLGVGVLNTSYGIAQMMLACLPGKHVLTQKRGWQRREAKPSEVSCCTADILRWHTPSIETSWKTPFLNPDPLTCWCGPENIAWVRIDDESSWALLDNGSTINTVTPQVVKACSLDVGPLSDLVSGTVRMNGLGRLFPWPWVMLSLGFKWKECGATTKIKWPWSSQIQLTLGPKCQSLWAHQPSTES